MRPILPSLLLTGTLASCAGGASDCDEGPLDVTLGTGVVAFEPLAEGDDVTMVFGPQGGWHIDVSARLAGIGPDVRVRPGARRVSDGLALAGDQPETFLLLAAYDEASCSGDAVGVRAFLDDADVQGPYVDFICSLDGEPVELSVEVLDFADRAGTASLVVTARTDAAQSCP